MQLAGRMAVSEAPEPSDIIWQNMYTTRKGVRREKDHTIAYYLVILRHLALINGQPNLTRYNATESFCGSAGDISHHLMGGPRDAPVLYLLQRVAQWLLSLGGRPVRQVRVDVCQLVSCSCMERNFTSNTY